MTYKEIPRFTRNANYRINVDWPYLEKQLQGWIEEREVAPLNIDPEFQRAHVWRPEQQSAYVEYILRGGISGREIYFNCIGWNSDYRGPFVLVDGKQRLEAVRSFLRDEVPVFGGHKCSQIEGRIPNSAFFYFNVNDLGTNAEVLQWYLDLNTGGVVHTTEELEKVRAMLAQEKQ
jgi:hypothetical protein